MLFGAKGVTKPGVIADSDQHVGVSSAGIDQIGVGDFIANIRSNQKQLLLLATLLANFQRSLIGCAG